MGVDQPTFQDCSLTMVTDRGSNEVTDFTTASWQPSATVAENRSMTTQAQSGDCQQPYQPTEMIRQTQAPAVSTTAAPVRGSRIVMGTSVIMDKFLHSFKAPVAPAYPVEPESSRHPSSGCITLKSLADDVTGDSVCDSFISVTPLDCPSEAMELSSASRASSYATCINCEKTAIE